MAYDGNNAEAIIVDDESVGNGDTGRIHSLRLTFKPHQPSQ